MKIKIKGELHGKRTHVWIDDREVSNQIQALTLTWDCRKINRVAISWAGLVTSVYTPDEIEVETEARSRPPSEPE